MDWATVSILSILLFSRVLHAAPREDQSLVCYDWKGKPVMGGYKYIPKKEDPCMACVCDGGFPIMCTAVLCSPPECHMWEQVVGECCKFNCIEPDHPTRNITELIPRNPKTSGDVDKANLGLRLIASTVTSFLILALLVFMVHRLRQRRMLIMMRRMHGDRRDEEAVAYMSNFDQVDMGIEFPPYEEPPPPYTPPKPPDIPQGEAPPPYTLTPNADNTNQRETNNNNNSCGTEGSQPTNGRGGRPLQGAGVNPGLRSSIIDPTSSTSQLDSNQATNPQEDSVSLSISRSNREIMAQTEALTPPGESQRTQQSPVEPEYENLRNTLLGQHSVDFSSAAETESVTSSPDFSPESLYPRAMAVSGNPAQGSPSSQIMVRMHNNSPRSQLVQAGMNDVMTTSAPPCLGGDMGHNHPTHTMNHSHSYMDDNKRPFLPSYRTQFLKRSDSVEIKLGSNSPRNSFYQDDQLDGSIEECGPDSTIGASRGHYHQETHSLSCSPDSDHSGGSGRTRRKTQVPNVTWNKSCKPFRIRLATDDQETECKERYDDIPRMAHRHSSYVGTCIASPSPPSSISHRNSLPPMELELPDPVDAILGASGTKYHKAGNPSGRSTDPSPCESQLVVGVSPTGSGKVSTTESSDGSPSYDRHSRPSGSAPHLSPDTPQSPTGRSMIRSGSITSQVSQISVCSETGEKKRPKPNITFPRSLRNDSRYPLSPFTSNYAAPMSSVPPMTRNRTHAKRSSGSRTSGSIPTTSPCESQPIDHSPTEAAKSSRTSQKTSNINEEKHRPGASVRLNMISYVDASPERDLSDVTTASSSTDSSGAYPKQPTSPLTNDSTMSSLSPLSPDGDMYNQNTMMPSPSTHPTPLTSSPIEQAETSWPTDKHTVRKVKKQSQKKRHSRSNTNDVSNSDKPLPTEHVSRSPERHRRLSRTVDASTTFKQYGFIDDPDVLNNARDLTGNVTVNSSSLPRNYNERRPNSQERRDNSHERRDHSHERRDHSRERRRSRERPNSRERSDNSKEGRTGRSKERSRERSHGENRSRSGERARKASPVERLFNCNGIIAGGGGNAERTLTIEVGDNGEMTTSVGTLERNEGRKREREHASQGASLERRKKRRSTGEVGSKATNTSTYPPLSLTNSFTFTNGHVVQPMDCESQSQQSKDSSSPVRQRSKRSKNNRTHENRHSLPMAVHRNR